MPARSAKAAAFSFYPGKNLGACGEGGAITTNDAAMAAHMKMIRDHGQAKKYYHDIEGYNGRLDSIQAGWLSVKLRHLAQWNESRRTLAHRYDKLLAEAKDSVVLPQEASWTKGVYHLYVVRVRDREALQAHLAEAGIGSGIHYPIPCTCKRLTRIFPTRRVISRLPSGWRPKSSPCRCFPS